MTTKPGNKRTCPECKAKYYDLGKKTPTCPKCGAVFKEEKKEKPSKKQATKQLQEELEMELEEEDLEEEEFDDIEMDGEDDMGDMDDKKNKILLQIDENPSDLIGGDDGIIGGRV